MENAKLRESTLLGPEGPKEVPPPGDGTKIYETDPMLNNHRAHLDYRYV